MDMKNVNTVVIGASLAMALCVTAGPAQAHDHHGDDHHGGDHHGGDHHGGGDHHFRGGPPRGPQPSHGASHPGDQHGPPPHAERPHVDRRAHWVGHESGPGDARYRVERPWARGRFGGAMGRGHVYRLRGWDAPRRRFWFGSSYFVVAPPDVGYVDDWSWTGDRVIIYEDPDHPGFYLAYNERTGTYAHVEYDGPQ
jgi:hypothetical protein